MGRNTAMRAPRILVLVLAVGAIGFAACNGSPEANPVPKAPAVTVVPVAQRAVPVYGQYVGQTEPVKTVEVRARVEGYLERQAVPDGGEVKAGDLLFVIDPPRTVDALRATLPNPARVLNERREGAR